MEAIFTTSEQDLKDPLQQIINEQWDSLDVPPINWSGLRAFLCSRVPFYAHALQLVDLVIMNDKKELPSCAFTNGYKVFISPKHYTALGILIKQKKKEWFSSPELGFGFLILHELGHLVFDSFGRQSHRDAKLWNVATDYQINQFVVKLMKDCGIFKSDQSYQHFMKVLRDNFVMDPSKYANLSAESTYDDLYHMGMGGSDFGNWVLNGDMIGDKSDENGKPLTPEEQMARDIIKNELRDYVAKNACKLAGQGTAYGRELAYVMEPPKVNLRDVLRKITDRELREEFGYDRRGSRMDHLIPRNMRLPSSVASEPDKIRKVMMVLDCSGSMTSEQLNDALNIIRELVCKHTKNPVHLIIHTSEICFSGPIKDYKDVPRNITGGTAFLPVLHEIARLKKEENIIPSACIWLTDGYAEFQNLDDPSGEGEYYYTRKNFPFHKILRWIISGSNQHPGIGSVYHIDEVGV